MKSSKISIILIAGITTLILRLQLFGEDKPLQTIAFASCARQDRPQPILDVICDQKPDLFLYMGDNIYGDTRDMSVLKAKYDMLAAKPEFQRLWKTCPVLATWDDHDMGENDAGGDYPKKDESQKLFLDFFKIPSDSPRRTQKGVYSSESFGPEGKRVQIILLDTRYFRSKLKSIKIPPSYVISKNAKKSSTTAYIPNNDPGVTMLGDEQWAWFEQQLRQPADIRIVVSSIQLIHDEGGFEKWGNFPKERERFFELIKSTNAKGVIIVSGDRHLADFSKISYPGISYPIYDITSSGITHANGGNANEKNKYRVSDSSLYRDKNFGLIKIDWNKTDPEVHVVVCDKEGAPVFDQPLKLSELR